LSVIVYPLLQSHRMPGNVIDVIDQERRDEMIAMVVRRLAAQ